ncbi:MAG: hypothetical protein JNK49_02320 [Planctomycetes bacterium]|nr:hypothetical protein [Planctomycetota bacterium]
MSKVWQFLGSPRGTLGRRPFVVAAVLALLVKVLVDAAGCRVLGLDYQPWLYLDPVGWALRQPRPHAGLWFLLWSLPFGWFGAVLVLRRLRSACWPPWLVVGFFVPWCNLVLFLLLAVAAAPVAMPPAASRAPRRQPQPIALAVLVPALVALASIGICARGLLVYGGVLFVATPFVQGLLVSYWAARRGLDALRVGLCSALVVAFGMLLVAWEGGVCIAMAAPIWLLLEGLGVMIGSALFSEAHEVRQVRRLPPALWLLGLLAAAGFEAVVLPVGSTQVTTTEVVVQAPREVVWRHLVAFSDLAPPEDWVFRAGIAYPVRASIDGTGPGAVRRCSFSTGDFVEPITVWDEPRLLRFSVAECPEPMREWNPFHDHVEAAHLHGYFVAEQGQFALHERSDGRTVLAGTTWYRHGLWPEWYWALWSEALVHKIHRRVLLHIRDEAERSGR